MSATPTHPATLDAALRRRATTLVWYLDLDLYDAETDTTETRHYATFETTLRPSDSQAPGRRYAGRLLPPELSWSLVRGQQVEGASTADSARLEWLDLGGRDADIAARQLSAQGQRATLWLGHPELDSALWRPFRFTGRRLQEVATGWALDLRTLDFPLDQPLPRRRLLGLGGCVALDGAHHLSIEPAADLSPGISPGISPGAPLAVEALVRTSAGGQQVAASKGPIPSCDWALWIPGDGAPRWWLRDAAGGVRVQVWLPLPGEE